MNPSGNLPRSSSYFNQKADPSSSFSPMVMSSSSSSDLNLPVQASGSSDFSNDVSQMPENPRKNMGHRRAHSEILMLPDDISFDSELGIVSGTDGPSFSDDIEEDILSMYLDMDKLNSSATSTLQGSDASGSSAPAKMDAAESSEQCATEKQKPRHQHSQSMDDSTSIKADMLISGSEEVSHADSRKAMSAAKLAELALIDPKRAKRIWANRQSAARSKERKMRYIAELERKVHTLQTDATSLSAQLSLLQRDTNGLTAENSELKLRLQTMEQQVHLQDALNNALKEEIQHLKIAMGQVTTNGGPVMNYPPFGPGPPLNSNHHTFHQTTLLTAQQFQQLHLHAQKGPHPFQPNQFHPQFPQKENGPDSAHITKD